MTSDPSASDAPDAAPAEEILAGVGKASGSHVVVIGSGFAGYFAARKLGAKARRRNISVTLVSDVDGFLYQPLLPNVAIGSVDPRSVMVPLSSTLPGVHLVRGRATGIDAAAGTVAVDLAAGHSVTIEYDRLLLAAGGVTRLFDIPGLSEHAVGFKTIGEAMYLRDLVLSRMLLADDEPDEAKRKDLLNFVVVGAGYSGTELAAQMSHMCAMLCRRFHAVTAADVRWMLLDTADKVMPELGTALGETALRLLRKRGVDVRLKTSVQSITDEGAELTDDTWVPRATVVWCAGVTPSPLVDRTGLPTVRGRLVVEADMRVAGLPGGFAIGDAAAVPDTTTPVGSDGRHPVCPPTAQHAMRQGSAVARNILADLRGHRLRPYKHHDLGLVVDLGGSSAVAKPLGVPLRGRLAKLVTRGYHVFALPTMRRRLRVLTDWMLSGRTPDDVTLGLRSGPSVLAAAEHPAQDPASS